MVVCGAFLIYPLAVLSIPGAYFVYLNFYYDLFGLLFMTVYWLMNPSWRNRILEWFAILQLLLFVTVVMLVVAARVQIFQVLYFPTLLIYFGGLIIMQYKALLSGLRRLGAAAGGVYVQRKQVYVWVARAVRGFAFIYLIWWMPLLFLSEYFSYDVPNRAIFWFQLLFLINSFYWSKFAQLFYYRRMREEQTLIGALVYLIILGIIVVSHLDPVELLLRNMMLTILILLMFYDTSVLQYEAALKYGGYVILLVGAANVSTVLRSYMDQIIRVVAVPWIGQLLESWYNYIIIQNALVTFLSLIVAILSYFETRKYSARREGIVIDPAEYKII